MACVNRTSLGRWIFSCGSYKVAHTHNLWLFPKCSMYDIFTYKTGSWIWGKCWDSYSSTMENMGFDREMLRLWKSTRWFGALLKPMVLGFGSSSDSTGALWGWLFSGDTLNWDWKLGTSKSIKNPDHDFLHQIAICQGWSVPFSDSNCQDFNLSCWKKAFSCSLPWGQALRSHGGGNCPTNRSCRMNTSKLLASLFWWSWSLLFNPVAVPKKARCGTSLRSIPATKCQVSPVVKGHHKVYPLVI